MLYNTIGGDFGDNNGEVSYLFPETAYIKVAGVNIPLGGLTVTSFGGPMSDLMLPDVHKMIEKINPALKNVYIMPHLDTYRLSEKGVPSKETYDKYNQMHNYVSAAEHDAVIKQTINIDTAMLKKLKNTRKLQKTIAEDLKTEFKAAAHSILTQNNTYPKFISLLSLDGNLKHVTHIILKFLSIDKYSIEIQHTSPILLNNVDPSKLKLDKNINPETCIERIDENNPNRLCLEDRVSSATQCITFLKPIKELTLKYYYSNLIPLLQHDLLSNKKLQDIEITYHHNQKQSQACAPYAIQNQINFLTQSFPDMQSNTVETPREREIRLKAEHLVMFCTLTNKCPYPPISQDILETTVKTKTELDMYTTFWYRNSEAVLKEINKRIIELPLEDRKTLYSTFDDPTTKITTLPSKFKAPLYDSIYSQKENALPASNYSFFSPSSNEQNVFSKGILSMLLCIGLPALFYCIRRCRKNKDKNNEREVNPPRAGAGPR